MTTSPIESGATELLRLRAENAALREELAKVRPSAVLWNQGHDMARTRYRGFDLVVELRSKGKPEFPWRVWCCGRMLRAGVGSAVDVAGKLAIGTVDSILEGKVTEEHQATIDAELRRYADHVAGLIGALETAARRTATPTLADDGGQAALVTAAQDLFAAFGLELRR